MTCEVYDIYSVSRSLIFIHAIMSDLPQVSAEGTSKPVRRLVPAPMLHDIHGNPQPMLDIDVLKGYTFVAPPLAWDELDRWYLEKKAQVSDLR